MCGEARLFLGGDAEVQGLSPRVRGSHCRVGHFNVLIGIIPACAGKPQIRRYSFHASRDYPRVCGEAVKWAAARPRAMGLSPRVRGSQLWGQMLPVFGRIIPACAGKPTLRARPRPRVWDYPRVCGEAGEGRQWRYLDTGLSPRVRGSHAPAVQPHLREGIIPACAGKPTYERPIVRHRRDYPRVCGEAWHVLIGLNPVRGLSPRVRGSLPGHPRTGALSGIIPACAGKPLGIKCLNL